MDYFVLIKNQKIMQTEIDTHKRIICEHNVKLKTQKCYFERQVLLNAIKYHEDMRDICSANLEKIQKSPPCKRRGPMYYFKNNTKSFPISPKNFISSFFVKRM